MDNALDCLGLQKTNNEIMNNGGINNGKLQKQQGTL